MTCTPADVRALDIAGTDFPDPPFTDAVLDVLISYADLLIDDTCFDTRAVKACAALAAHLGYKLYQGGSAVGQVTAEAAGGLSRSYAQVMSGANDSDLSTTTYGQLFIMLRDVTVCGVIPMVLKSVPP